MALWLTGGPAVWKASPIARELALQILREADRCFHHGDYEGAIVRDLMAATLNPRLWQAFSAGGWLLESLGIDRRNWNLELAGLRVYLLGAAANPDVCEAQMDVAFWYYNRGYYEVAAEWFARACEVAPPDYQAPWRMRAHALFRAGRKREALAIWEELARRTPDDPVVRLNLEKVKRALEGEGK